MSKIEVPQLGESVTEATVGKWLKSKGDAVKKDEALVELETDKVAVEVYAQADGVLSSIAVEEGETVEVGALLGEIEDGGEASADDYDADEDAASAEDASADEDEDDSGDDEAEDDASGDDDGDGDGEIVEVEIPQMGESVAEGEIGDWLVGVGDSVKVDDPLVEVETDKAAVEVPSPVDGVIEEQVVSSGDAVEVGSVIAKIRKGASGGAKKAKKGKDDKSAKKDKKAEKKPEEKKDSGKAMPAAQRVISEHGLDPSKIEGTGKGGRITKSDAMAAIESADAQRSEEKAEKAKAKPAPRDLKDREERVPMTRLRRTIAKRLKAAQDNAAMLTTFNDVDMSAVMNMRSQYKDLFEKKHGVRLGFMSVFIKACVHALKEIPAVNAEIDGDDIIYKNYYDLGVAVGTPTGLVVPVVRDCDSKSMAEIEKTINDLGARARDNELKLDELQGGTFTLSNGGVYGSLLSTPILNPPQSGILGMHRIDQRPVAIDGKVEIRPMMYLALSYDHRIVDGKEAVTFLVRVKEQLEDPERLLLDL
ncbi:2-oxoglutarate dehydrogenase complex dihydrolipoyllysine-residue succinyltransferase [Euryhalocaulis caribicus]|uniref:2-oxoglutarate dehydrogenase complex dihydrolipoyllysine-residue succinyltransferase n=1 Tax=Euryhalocaulis caribicus TaxID=1161401 RepID=UPI0003A7166E|nr:2-oxoglutarate dehydrogenase complex dihydrolipoyllysine-residue succinyltransferase [Euryhalocaulis caribicus]